LSLAPEARGQSNLRIARSQPSFELSACRNEEIETLRSSNCSLVNSSGLANVAVAVLRHSPNYPLHIEAFGPDVGLLRQLRSLAKTTQHERSARRIRLMQLRKLDVRFRRRFLCPPHLDRRALAWARPSPWPFKVSIARESGQRTSWRLKPSPAAGLFLNHIRCGGGRRRCRRRVEIYLESVNQILPAGRASRFTKFTVALRKI